MKAIDINKLKEEANRCFLCKVPKCKKYCPIDTQIPAVIQLFKENKIDEAGEILFNNNPLSAKKQKESQRQHERYLNRFPLSQVQTPILETDNR